jgi:hypothetical protein
MEAMTTLLVSKEKIINASCFEREDIQAVSCQKPLLAYGREHEFDCILEVRIAIAYPHAVPFFLRIIVYY